MIKWNFIEMPSVGFGLSDRPLCYLLYIHNIGRYRQPVSLTSTKQHFNVSFIFDTSIQCSFLLVKRIGITWEIFLHLIIPVVKQIMTNNRQQKPSKRFFCHISKVNTKEIMAFFFQKKNGNRISNTNKAQILNK